VNILVVPEDFRRDQYLLWSATPCGLVEVALRSSSDASQFGIVFLGRPWRADAPSKYPAERAPDSIRATRTCHGFPEATSCLIR